MMLDFEDDVMKVTCEFSLLCELAVILQKTGVYLMS